MRPKTPPTASQPPVRPAKLPSPASLSKLRRLNEGKSMGLYYTWNVLLTPIGGLVILSPVHRARVPAC